MLKQVNKNTARQGKSARYYAEFLRERTMIFVCIGFLVGSALLLRLPDSFIASWAVVLVAASNLLIFMFLRRWNWAACISCLLFGCVCGGAWQLFAINSYHQSLLPVEVQKKAIDIDGCIEQLRTVQPKYISYYFMVHRANDYLGAGSMLMLSEYFPSSIPKLGQCFTMTVKLKRPHSAHQYYGFNFEQHLVSREVVATGYVTKRSAAYVPTGLFNRLNWWVNQQRQAVAERLYSSDQPNSAVIVNLVTGIRLYLSSDQWRLFRESGIAHLMAISGLHVSLLFVFGMAIARVLGAIIGYIWVINDLTIFSRVFAVSLAGVYAIFSGFAISTQRAWLMLLVGVVAFVLARQISRWTILWFVAALICCSSPLALLGPSIWLSASSVAALLFVDHLSSRNWWSKLLHAHYALFVVLTPISLLWFDAASAISPLVNLLYLPVFTWIQVPLTIIALIVPVVQGVNIYLMDLSLTVIAAINGFVATQFELGVTSFSQIVLFFTGAVLLLFRINWRFSMIGLLFWSACWWRAPISLNGGEADIYIFDVGQASAALIVTATETGLIDAGASMRAEQFVMGTLKPTLQQYQRTKLDWVIISHADDDHIGGLNEVVKHYDSARLVHSQAGQIMGSSAQCGANWRSGGITLTTFAANASSGNNRSCLVRVDNGFGTVLFAGDVEKRAEYQLIESVPTLLAADVLITPHHGSMTSSTPKFLTYVGAQYGVTSSGYLNRFGFPKPEMLARYHRFNIDHRSTANDGSVLIKLRNRAINSDSIASSRHKFPNIWQIPRDEVLKINN